MPSKDAPTDALIAAGEAVVRLLMAKANETGLDDKGKEAFVLTAIGHAHARILAMSAGSDPRAQRRSINIAHESLLDCVPMLADMIAEAGMAH